VLKINVLVFVLKEREAGLGSEVPELRFVLCVS